MSTTNLALRELHFDHVRKADEYAAIILKILDISGVESLIIAPFTKGEHFDLQSNEDLKLYLLRALDKNWTLQKFEITGFPWNDQEITFLESVRHRNACISSLIGSSSSLSSFSDEILCFGLWPHVLFRIMQKFPIQTTLIYDAFKSLSPVIARGYEEEEESRSNGRWNLRRFLACFGKRVRKK
jgi:hypothetical protein